LMGTFDKLFIIPFPTIMPIFRKVRINVTFNVYFHRAIVTGKKIMP